MEDDDDTDGAGDVATGSYINEKVPALVHEISEKVDVRHVDDRGNENRDSPRTKPILVHGRSRGGSHNVLPGSSIDSSRTMN